MIGSNEAAQGKDRSRRAETMEPQKIARSPTPVRISTPDYNQIQWRQGFAAQNSPGPTQPT